ncbi:unnamed protein product [Lampetra planeri]
MQTLHGGTRVEDRPSALLRERAAPTATAPVWAMRRLGASRAPVRAASIETHAPRDTAPPHRVGDRHERPEAAEGPGLGMNATASTSTPTRSEHSKGRPFTMRLHNCSADCLFIVLSAARASDAIPHRLREVLTPFTMTVAATAGAARGLVVRSDSSRRLRPGPESPKRERRH